MLKKFGISPLAYQTRKIITTAQIKIRKYNYFALIIILASTSFLLPLMFGSDLGFSSGKWWWPEKNRFLHVLFLIVPPLFAFKTENWSKYGHFVSYTIISSLLIIVWAQIYYWPILSAPGDNIFPYILILCLFLNLKNPSLTGLSAVLIIYSNYQYYIPFNLAGMADRRLPLGIIFCGSIFFSISGILNLRRNLLEKVLIMMIAGYYFNCGLAKSPYLWLTDNSVINLVNSSVIHGWSLPFDWLSSFLQKNNKLLDPILTALTLFIELGFILVIPYPKLLIYFLIGTIGLHTGIYVVSGIFFWKWIAVLFAGVLSVIFNSTKKRSYSNNAAISNIEKSIAITSIIFSAYFFSPPGLGWFDGRLCQIYDIYGELPDGRTVKIPPDLFSPHDIGFTQKSFRFLDKEKTIAGTYGVIRDYDIYMALQKATNIKEVNHIIHEKGVILYNKNKRIKFHKLVKKIINRKKNIPNSLLSKIIPTPYKHIYEGTPELTKKNLNQIRRIIINRTNIFHKNESTQILSQKKIDIIELDLR